MAKEREPAAQATPPVRSEGDETCTDRGGSSGDDTRIGVYRVLAFLGAGGMGDVFLAFDERLQRRVAIKRVRSDAPLTARSRERLRREAAAAAALSHPAIVHVYDILENDGSGEAIVMEYVEGETLAETRARSPLPVRQAVGIARQVAEGLAAAHAAGLIHRDLKTRNVMLTSSGQAKILDFGLAKRLRHPDQEPLTAEGAVPGTLRSMSPEQARGAALDARSDLFSLGIVLYEICTGREPFEGSDAAETRHKLISEPARPVTELNPAVPKLLADLIGGLLEKDPERRPSSAAEVATRLAEIEGQLVASGPGSAAGHAARSGRTVSLGRALLLLLLLAVAGGALATYLLRAQRPRPVIAVLVTEPTFSPPGSRDERSGLAAFALREAILRALTSLEAVEAIGPEELPSNPLPLEQTVRAVAADEVVLPIMSCQGSSCRVSLRRQRGVDARILEDSGPFEVSSEPEESLALTRAVAFHVVALFDDRRSRASRKLEVKSADYQGYLAVRRRREAGVVLSVRDIDELEKIVRSSPDLTEASILAASAARILRDRPRAARILREAEARDATDPLLAYEAFWLQLEHGSLAEAQAALAELERRAPADARVAMARARLLIRQGKLPEAVEVRRRMLGRRLSWRNLWNVADLEIKLADLEGARGHLVQLLEVSPGNPRGRAKMAEMEWLLGDPARAVAIYEELLKEHETQQNVGNLGWSLILAGDYAAAARAYRRALELQPDDLFIRLNLGIALDGLHDADGARAVYREVLAGLTPRAAESLSASERLLKAEALARVGEPVQAVELTMQALGEGERDPQVLLQAAVIYALCGDANHALVHAREARRRGLSARWLAIPGFESLRGLPAFQALLTS
jgi:eukaryotic-like serine/threonine-protein kinase